MVVVAAAMLWPRRRSRGEGAHPLQPLPRPQAETGGVIRQRPSVRPRDGPFVSLRCNDVRGKILRKRGEWDRSMSDLMDAAGTRSRRRHAAAALTEGECRGLRSAPSCARSKLLGRKRAHCVRSARDSRSCACVKLEKLRVRTELAAHPRRRPWGEARRGKGGAVMFEPSRGECVVTTQRHPE